MSKYIIEIKPEYEDTTKGIMVLGARDSKLFVDTVDVANLEVLNSDYINEHFGDLQDTAYQRGLDDAWEAARKLFSSMANSDIEKVFPTEWNNGGFHALINLQPQEVIAKLKAYEEKQDDNIEVGDEICNIDTDRNDTGIVTWRAHDDIYVMWTDGSAGRRNVKDYRKTGRHFDIAKILEAMKA